MAKTHRRYQEVAARISRYIAEKGLEPGSRLPGEIDLAKICGVSRPTIREAMVALEMRKISDETPRPPPPSKSRKVRSNRDLEPDFETSVSVTKRTPGASRAFFLCDLF